MLCNKNVNKDIDKALDATDEKEALPYWKDLQKYTSAKGDAPYCWLVNVKPCLFSSRWI